MNARPRMKLELTTFDKAIEMLSWGVLLLIWILVLASYSGLPETIPIHYNLEGQADGFGGKWHIFILVSIATLLFAGLTILNKFPQIFNYPVKITEDNAVRQYTNATKLIRFLKFISLVAVILMIMKIIQN